MHSMQRPKEFGRTFDCVAHVLRQPNHIDAIGQSKEIVHPMQASVVAVFDKRIHPAEYEVRDKVARVLSLAQIVRADGVCFRTY